VCTVIHMYVCSMHGGGDAAYGTLTNPRTTMVATFTSLLKLDASKYYRCFKFFRKSTTHKRESNWCTLYQLLMVEVIYFTINCDIFSKVGVHMWKPYLTILYIVLTCDVTHIFSCCTFIDFDTGGDLELTNISSCLATSCNNNILTNGARYDLPYTVMGSEYVTKSLVSF
jgi:hypothetical protein